MSTIDEMIENFEGKPKMLKGMMLGAAQRAREDLEFERGILKAVKREDHVVEAVIGPIAILRCDKKIYEEYPYTAAYLAADIEHAEWQSTHSVWPTIELAILDAIGHRHDGINTRFAMYAGKMIGLVD